MYGYVHVLWSHVKYIRASNIQFKFIRIGPRHSVTQCASNCVYDKHTCIIIIYHNVDDIVLYFRYTGLQIVVSSHDNYVS